MYSFPTWSSDWFYLGILKNWWLASVLFLVLRPVLAGWFSARWIVKRKCDVPLFIALFGMSTSATYFAFAFLGVLPKNILFFGILFFAGFGYSVEKAKRFAAILPSIIMGFLTFYCWWLLSYLSWLFYRVSVTLNTTRPITPILKEVADNEMWKGIAIGTIFLIVYATLFVVQWKYSQKKRSK
jgi:hypothetical protein